MPSSLRGIPAAAGIAIGACVFYDPKPPFVPQHQIAPEAITLERERLAQAIEASMHEVTQLRDQVRERLGYVAYASALPLPISISSVLN